MSQEHVLASLHMFWVNPSALASSGDLPAGQVGTADSQPATRHRPMDDSPASVASILLQNPVRVAVHADKLLPLRFSVACVQGMAGWPG